MSRLKQPLLLAFFLLINLALFAQDNSNTAEGADALRAGGKIYVVMAVVITILAGLIVYVYRLDRKITKIEKEEKQLN